MRPRVAPLIALLLCAVAAPASAGVVVGYLFGAERLAKIPRLDGLTMVDYAFAVPAADGSIPDLGADDAANLRATAAKARASGVEVLLSIGGWGGSAGFSGAASSDATRARFAAAAAALVEKFGLDGVDVDWEYPDQPGAGNPHRPEDRANFPLLLRATRAALDARSAALGRSRRFRLTVAVGADEDYLPHADLVSALDALDFVNLMAYDIYNGNDAVAGHHANLRRARGQDPDRRSVEESVGACLAAGVPAAKLVLGFPFYGRVWRGVDGGADGLYGTARGKGELVGWDELADSWIGKRGFVRIWDDEAKAAHLWNPATRDFVSYGDPRAAEEAARFVREKNLAGVMFWELGGASKRRELFDALTREPRTP